MSSDKLYSTDFEVFGTVQGVFFRRDTKIRAKELKLTGWCMNTAAGTVKGQIEGNAKQIEEMQDWLQRIGSRMSKIERVILSPKKQIDFLTFADFKILH